jgi:hypothetical protein
MEMTLSILSQLMGAGVMLLMFAANGVAAEPAAPAKGFSDEDYAQRVAELKKTVPAGFTIIIEKPFVVIGDDTPEKVMAACEHTVRWSVRMLKQDYFTADPKTIMDIWLFKDKASYEANTKAIFHEDPISPYGYCSYEHNALIMNIGTGGGTLVHEIVHAFVASNFGSCPTWFNEGLASLYEQCGERDGHIVGYTNWRLEALQKAIKAGTLMSFKDLTATTTEAFYKDKGVNYGQARYLCYYLQEHGLLVKYYREFHKNYESDKTGYETLVKALDAKDMAAWQRDWEKYVAGLKFPESPKE